VNWTGYALQAAANLRVTRDLHLKIGKLQHLDSQGKVDWQIEEIEATPSELASIMKEGLSIVFGPKSNP